MESKPVISATFDSAIQDIYQPGLPEIAKQYVSWNVSGHSLQASATGRTSADQAKQPYPLTVLWKSLAPKHTS